VIAEGEDAFSGVGADAFSAVGAGAFSVMGAGAFSVMGAGAFSAIGAILPKVEAGSSNPDRTGFSHRLNDGIDVYLTRNNLLQDEDVFAAAASSSFHYNG